MSTEAKRPRGRPPVPDDRKAIRITITLSPAAKAILDERGNGISPEIERLIMESAARQGG